MNPTGLGLPAARFTGLEVRVSAALAGGKLAVQFGEGPVYVSPAMWELMRHANEADLRLLMETIRVLKLPPLPDYARGLPPTLTAGGPADYDYSAAKLDMRAFQGPGRVTGDTTS